MLKSTSGNEIYQLLVKSYQTWRSTPQAHNGMKYAEGISHICLSRQMGHTTAILQLFKENAENTFFITPVLNKQVRQAIPNECWDHVQGVDFSRYMKPHDKRKTLKFLMVDFCGMSDKVREQVIADAKNTFINLEYIFIVQ